MRSAPLDLCRRAGTHGVERSAQVASPKARRPSGMTSPWTCPTDSTAADPAEGVWASSTSQSPVARRFRRSAAPPVRRVRTAQANVKVRSTGLTNRSSEPRNLVRPMLPPVQFAPMDRDVNGGCNHDAWSQLMRWPALPEVCLTSTMSAVQTLASWMQNQVWTYCHLDADCSETWQGR